MTRPTLILLVSFASSKALAAPCDSLIVRQNTNLQKDVAKPAFVAAKFQNGEKPLYTVGVGVTCNLIDTTQTTFGPLAEALLNTSPNKDAAKSFKLGFSLERQLLATEPGGHRASPILLMEGTFKNDRVKRARSLELSAEFTSVFLGKGSPLRPNIYFKTASLKGYYSPQAGLEYERIYSAEKKEDEGEIVRAVGMVDLNLYPAYQKLDERLVIAVSYAFRQDLSDTTADADDSHPLLTISGTYYFYKSANKKKHIGVGATYMHGEDPSEGFAKQRFLEIGLRAQFK